MTYDHGRFVWFELLTKEIDKAKAFYTEVLNWKVEPMDMPGGAYDLIKLGDAGIGGFMKPPMEGIPPHWVSYVSVADVDATAKKVVEHGGRTLADAMDIPTVGRIQPVMDPDGGAFALFKGENGDAEKQSGPGSWHWNELWAKDPGKSVAFYEKVLGYSNSEMPMPQGNYNVLMIEKDKPAGGIVKAPNENVPQAWVQFVEVENTDQTVERAKSHGGEVVAPAMDVPEVGRFAVLKDPVGGVIGVIKPAAQS